MSKQILVVLTVGLAIPAFVLSRIIWPDPPGAPVPPAGLLPLLIAAYASAGWALVSWWPHSNMHRANTTLEGLVLIDWVFHLTLIVGAAIVGLYLYQTVTEQRVARA